MPILAFYIFLNHRFIYFTYVLKFTGEEYYFLLVLLAVLFA